MNSLQVTQYGNSIATNIAGQVKHNGITHIRISYNLFVSLYANTTYYCFKQSHHRRITKLD